MRKLPKVLDHEIFSFKLVDENKWEEVHFVFQKNNGYFISWGKSEKMIIFNDHSRIFKEKV